MQLDICQIPPEGLLLEGEEETDIFALDAEGIRSSSPLRYRLEATYEGSNLFLQGWIEAEFDLRCVGCLEFFPRTIRIEPYHLQEEVENPGILDLTERLREDILLDLPGYPRCNEADSSRECLASGQFAPKSEFNRTEADQAGKSDAWSALDDLPDREGSDQESRKS